MQLYQWFCSVPWTENPSETKGATLHLHLQTDKHRGTSFFPRYELGYHRPEELGPFLASYVERRFGETTTRRAPNVKGEDAHQHD